MAKNHILLNKFINKNHYHIVIALVLLFFCFWIIGMFFFNLQVEEFRPDISAYLYSNIWLIVAYIIFILIFTISMIYNNTKYLLLTYIIFFFIYLTIPFLEPYGRTYDSYKYVGNATIIIRDGGIVTGIDNAPVYFNWPGSLIIASSISNILGVDFCTSELPIFFVKSFFIFTFIIFIFGYYLFSNYLFKNKILALKSGLIVLLFQSLMTLEFGPNNITYVIIPLTLFSFLKIGDNIKWILPTIFLMLFIIVSHPFNILFVLTILLILWVGIRILGIFQKTPKNIKNKKNNILFKSTGIIIIILFGILYLFYIFAVGTYILNPIKDFIGTISQNPNNTNGPSNLDLSMSIPELVRRSILLSIILMALIYMIRSFISILKKSNQFSPTMYPFALSFSVIILGILVYLSLSLSKLNPTLNLHARVFSFFILIGVLLFSYLLDSTLIKLLKKKRERKKIQRVISCSIVIFIIVLIPFSYFISSYADEKYFAPTDDTMHVSEYGNEIAISGDLIFDNVYPRTVYQNRQKLDEVIISASIAWLNRGEEPDVFVLTDMDPYFKEYHSFKDHAESNNYLKIYSTERSVIYIKG